MTCSRHNDCILFTKVIASNNYTEFSNYLMSSVNRER